MSRWFFWGAPRPGSRSPLAHPPVVGRACASANRLWGAAPAGLLLALAAGCDAPPLERSCAGQEVLLCAPYEYAEVTAASLEPDELPIADFSMSAHIRVETARCDMAPAAHVVELLAIVPDRTPADGGTGEPVSVTSLLMLEDGRDGDPTPDDGIIDVTVPNPFLTTVPADSDIRLRFVPRSTTPGGCTGAAVEIPYHTGPMRSM